MKTYKLEAEIELPISIEKAWDFFSNPNNLTKIMPKSMKFEVIEGASLPLFPGQVIQYTVTPLAFFKTTWLSEINHIKKPHFFVDTQLEGPYKLWHHKHFLKETSNGTLITDVIHYQVPFGIIGRLLHPIIIKPKLDKIFEYRTKNITSLFN
ncbi:SRPBCC family protein [Aquimarina agarilytica]|uniref:SRPBCC family protein n=1 Tax=Aquimarina agarilytica TaxID=1087449 RepID=UPI000289D691|nr:SRPBCC family protein [Aquimarina agarilytica]